MSKILVFGHQNPDSDAIGSSVAFAYLAKEAYGLDTEAVALGTPNEETAFVLNYFGVDAPRVITSAKAEGAEQVILTDHNEFQQSVSDIAEVEVYGVVDHHRVANFETASPLYMRLEPVGSASSIVYRMFKEHGVAVPKEIAGLMLSGLISDTLLLKSPTTHPSDKVIAPELAELAGVNLEEYGLAMLKAGTNLASKSAEELIDIDAKTFELNGNNVRVAQVNTVDIAEVLERQAEIEAAIQAANAANGYSDFVLMITDIVNSNSEILALGTPNEETAFVLNYFGVEAPRVITSAKAEGAEQVILTDHNEFQQSVSDIAEVEVYGVVDHHRVANFETASPLYMRLEPVGSASSIVYRMFKEHGVAVPKEIAGLMLSGLISDTLLLKSPTTHPSDKVIAPELAELAGVNLEEYGLAMLKAGTNLASKSAEELIDIDAKTFELNGNNVRVAQVNTVDIAEVLERQAEIEAAIQAANAANGYSDFVLMITDIVNSNSEILALGVNMDKVEAAFNFKLENNHAFLPGAVSRKKQVVPQLTESFNA